MRATAPSKRPPERGTVVRAWWHGLLGHGPRRELTIPTDGAIGSFWAAVEDAIAVVREWAYAHMDEIAANRESYDRRDL